MTIYFDIILYRSSPLTGLVCLQPEKVPLLDTFSELDFVHPNGDKITSRMVKTCRNPGHFINPF